MKPADDTRMVLDHVLPHFANAIGKMLAENPPDPDWVANHSSNRGVPFQFTDRVMDFSKPWVRKTERESVGEVHSFYAQSKPESGDKVKRGPFWVHPHAVISFYNLRVTGVDKVELGDLDVIPIGGGSETYSEEVVNDGPTEIPLRTRTEKETETETESSHEHSLAVMVSAEYRRRTTAKAGGEFSGIAMEAEVEQELTLKTEINTEHKWAYRRSRKLRETVAREMDITIAPYHRFTIVADESVKRLHQDVFMTGRLDCSVRLDSYMFASADFDRLDDLLDCLGGTKPGFGRWGEWYSSYGRGMPEATMRGLILPQVRMNLPVDTQRTRYSKVTLSQKSLKTGEEKVEPLPKDWPEEI